MGDIILGRGVESGLRRQSAGFAAPFVPALPALSSDLLFGNLEGPLYSGSPTPIGQPDRVTLWNPAEAVIGLQRAGFDCLSLANNHTLDLGAEGALGTVRQLRAAGIVPVGAGESPGEAAAPAILTCGGRKTAVLAYTAFARESGAGGASVNCFDLDRALSEVRGLGDRADLVFVSIHWGREDSTEVGDGQRVIARALVDAGADAVLGHHPHRFQDVEVYRRRPIFYSLGNFLFDQDPPESREGFIAQLDFEGDTCRQVRLVPYRIVDRCRVVPLEGGEARQSCEAALPLLRRSGTRPTLVGQAIAIRP